MALNKFFKTTSRTNSHTQDSHQYNN